MISALPDVKHTKIGSKDEFMILACDGIWNSFTSEEVVAFVRDRIQKGEKKMSAICEEVSSDALIKKKCSKLMFFVSFNFSFSYLQNA